MESCRMLVVYLLFVGLSGAAVQEIKDGLQGPAAFNPCPGSLSGETHVFKVAGAVAIKLVASAELQTEDASNPKCKVYLGQKEIPDLTEPSPFLNTVESPLTQFKLASDEATAIDWYIIGEKIGHIRNTVTLTVTKTVTDATAVSDAAISVFPCSNDGPADEVRIFKIQNAMALRIESTGDLNLFDTKCQMYLRPKYLPVVGGSDFKVTLSGEPQFKLIDGATQAVDWFIVGKRLVDDSNINVVATFTKDVVVPTDGLGAPGWLNPCVGTFENQLHVFKVSSALVLKLEASKRFDDPEESCRLYVGQGVIPALDIQNKVDFSNIEKLSKYQLSQGASSTVDWYIVGQKIGQAKNSATLRMTKDVTSSTNAVTGAALGATQICTSILDQYTVFHVSNAMSIRMQGSMGTESLADKCSVFVSKKVVPSVCDEDAADDAPACVHRLTFDSAAPKYKLAESESKPVTWYIVGRLFQAGNQQTLTVSVGVSTPAAAIGINPCSGVVHDTISLFKISPAFAIKLEATGSINSEICRVYIEHTKVPVNVFSPYDANSKSEEHKEDILKNSATDFTDPGISKYLLADGFEPTEAAENMPFWYLVGRKVGVIANTASIIISRSVITSDISNDPPSDTDICGTIEGRFNIVKLSGGTYVIKMLAKNPDGGLDNELVPKKLCAIYVSHTKLPSRIPIEERPKGKDGKVDPAASAFSGRTTFEKTLNSDTTVKYAVASGASDKVSWYIVGQLLSAQNTKTVLTFSKELDDLQSNPMGSTDPCPSETTGMLTVFILKNAVALKATPLPVTASTDPDEFADQLENTCRIFIRKGSIPETTGEYLTEATYYLAEGLEYGAPDTGVSWYAVGQRVGTQSNNVVRITFKRTDQATAWNFGASKNPCPTDETGHLTVFRIPPTIVLSLTALQDVNWYQCRVYMNYKTIPNIVPLSEQINRYEKKLDVPTSYLQNEKDGTTYKLASGLEDSAAWYIVGQKTCYNPGMETSDEGVVVTKATTCNANTANFKAGAETSANDISSPQETSIIPCPSTQAGLPTGQGYLKVFMISKDSTKASLVLKIVQSEQIDVNHCKIYVQSGHIPDVASGGNVEFKANTMYFLASGAIAKTQWYIIGKTIGDHTNANIKTDIPITVTSELGDPIQKISTDSFNPCQANSQNSASTDGDMVVYRMAASAQGAMIIKVIASAPLSDQICKVYAKAGAVPDRTDMSSQLAFGSSGLTRYLLADGNEGRVPWFIVGEKVGEGQNSVTITVTEEVTSDGGSLAATPGGANINVCTGTTAGRLTVFTVAAAWALKLQPSKKIDSNLCKVYVKKGVMPSITSEDCTLPEKNKDTRCSVSFPNTEPLFFLAEGTIPDDSTTANAPNWFIVGQKIGTTANTVSLSTLAHIVGGNTPGDKIVDGISKDPCPGVEEDEVTIVKTSTKAPLLEVQATTEIETIHCKVYISHSAVPTTPVDGSTNFYTNWDKTKYNIADGMTATQRTEWFIVGVKTSDQSKAYALIITRDNNDDGGITTSKNFSPCAGATDGKISVFRITPHVVFTIQSSMAIKDETNTCKVYIGKKKTPPLIQTLRLYMEETCTTNSDICKHILAVEETGPVDWYVVGVIDGTIDSDKTLGLSLPDGAVDNDGETNIESWHQVKSVEMGDAKTRMLSDDSGQIDLCPSSGVGHSMRVFKVTAAIVLKIEPHTDENNVQKKQAACKIYVTMNKLPSTKSTAAAVSLYGTQKQPAPDYEAFHTWSPSPTAAMATVYKMAEGQTSAPDWFLVGVHSGVTEENNTELLVTATYENAPTVEIGDNIKPCCKYQQDCILVKDQINIYKVENAMSLSITMSDAIAEDKCKVYVRAHMYPCTGPTPCDSVFKSTGLVYMVAAAGDLNVAAATDWYIAGVTQKLDTTDETLQGDLKIEKAIVTPIPAGPNPCAVSGASNAGHLTVFKVNSAIALKIHHIVENLADEKCNIYVRHHVLPQLNDSDQAKFELLDDNNEPDVYQMPAYWVADGHTGNVNWYVVGKKIGASISQSTLLMDRDLTSMPSALGYSSNMIVPCPNDVKGSLTTFRVTGALTLSFKIGGDGVQDTLNTCEIYAAPKVIPALTEVNLVHFLQGGDGSIQPSYRLAEGEVDAVDWYVVGKSTAVVGEPGKLSVAADSTMTLNGLGSGGAGSTITPCPGENNGRVKVFKVTRAISIRIQTTANLDSLCEIRVSVDSIPSSTDNTVEDLSVDHPKYFLVNNKQHQGDGSNTNWFITGTKKGTNEVKAKLVITKEITSIKNDFDFSRLSHPVKINNPCDGQQDGRMFVYKVSGALSLKLEQSRSEGNNCKLFQAVGGIPSPSEANQIIFDEHQSVEDNQSQTQFLLASGESSAATWYLVAKRTVSEEAEENQPPATLTISSDIVLPQNALAFNPCPETGPGSTHIFKVTNAIVMKVVTEEQLQLDSSRCKLYIQQKSIPEIHPDTEVHPKDYTQTLHASPSQAVHHVAHDASEGVDWYLAGVKIGSEPSTTRLIITRDVTSVSPGLGSVKVCNGASVGQAQIFNVPGAYGLKLVANMPITGCRIFVQDRKMPNVELNADPTEISFSVDNWTSPKYVIASDVKQAVTWYLTAQRTTTVTPASAALTITTTFEAPTDVPTGVETDGSYITPCLSQDSGAHTLFQVRDALVLKFVADGPIFDDKCKVYVGKGATPELGAGQLDFPSNGAIFKLAEGETGPVTWFIVGYKVGGEASLRSIKVTVHVASTNSGLPGPKTPCPASAIDGEISKVLKVPGTMSLMITSSVGLNEVTSATSTKTGIDETRCKIYIADEKIPLLSGESTRFTDDAPTKYVLTQLSATVTWFLFGEKIGTAVDDGRITIKTDSESLITGSTLGNIPAAGSISPCRSAQPNDGQLSLWKLTEAVSIKVTAIGKQSQDCSNADTPCSIDQDKCKVYIQANAFPNLDTAAANSFPDGRARYLLAEGHGSGDAATWYIVGQISGNQGEEGRLQVVADVQQAHADAWGSTEKEVTVCNGDHNGKFTVLRIPEAFILTVTPTTQDMPDCEIYIGDQRIPNISDISKTTFEKSNPKYFLATQASQTVPWYLVGKKKIQHADDANAEQISEATNIEGHKLTLQIQNGTPLDDLTSYNPCESKDVAQLSVRIISAASILKLKINFHSVKLQEW